MLPNGRKAMKDKDLGYMPEMVAALEAVLGTGWALIGADLSVPGDRETAQFATLLATEIELALRAMEKDSGRKVTPESVEKFLKLLAKGDKKAVYDASFATVGLIGAVLEHRDKDEMAASKAQTILDTYYFVRKHAEEMSEVIGKMLKVFREALEEAKVFEE